MRREGERELQSAEGETAGEEETVERKRQGERELQSAEGEGEGIEPVECS